MQIPCPRFLAPRPHNRSLTRDVVGDPELAATANVAPTRRKALAMNLKFEFFPDRSLIIRLPLLEGLFSRSDGKPYLSTERARTGLSA
jgi:hypothetical protein